MNAPDASSVPLIPVRPEELRHWLKDERTKLARNYRGEPQPHRFLAPHAKLVDTALAALWNASDLPTSLALIAVGGYGRGTLFPHSDVDVLVLKPSDHDDEVRGVERFISRLWDIGIEVGSSVRTIDDCLDEGAKDATVLTTLLESRCIAGHHALAHELEVALRKRLDLVAFFDAKLAEQRARHARFQDTAYNLEPNLKEGPGGLRDLQMVLWLANAAGYGGSWKDLAGRGFITAAEARAIAADQRTIEDLRIRLHLAAHRREDRIVFDYQHQLATELGFKGHAGHRASEGLMLRYYRAAKEIRQYNTILLQALNAAVRPKESGRAKPIDAHFAIRNRLLVLREPDAFEREPRTILRAVLHLQHHEAEVDDFSADLLRALSRARGRIDAVFRADSVNRQAFLDILRAPGGVTRALRKLNHHGILGRYLPVFGRIVGQMQFDLFHVYTVDEHILMVVRNLRRFATPRFAHEFPFCTELMNHFERPEVLYIAALFHDIAKGRGGDHSTLGASDVRRFCKQHDLPEADAALAEWLVGEHLAMSRTAQKQDVSDPDVVAAFAAKCGNERYLTALYLLTCADVRGTSPTVWNAWKAKLLEDLFRSARRMLSGDSTLAATREEWLAAKKHEAERILKSYPAQGEPPIWRHVDERFFQRFEAQEIAWITRTLWARPEPKHAVVRVRASPVGEGLDVLIYARDELGLFARICQYFERVFFDILQAKIYTTPHGYALDTFLVMDRGKRHVTYRDVMATIEKELGEALGEHKPLAASARARISRRVKHYPIDPEIQIQPAAEHHTLSVVASDRPGLLSAIARVFVTHGVNLHDARIATLGERAEDTFDVSGAALDNAVTRAALERDLEVALRPV